MILYRSDAAADACSANLLLQNRQLLGAGRAPALVCRHLQQILPSANGGPPLRLLRSCCITHTANERRAASTSSNANVSSTYLFLRSWENRRYRRLCMLNSLQARATSSASPCHLSSCGRSVALISCTIKGTKALLANS